jgi:fructose 1,6-bisphosphatase
MNNDNAEVTVTITTTLEKFNGEYTPGDEPVEIITTSETMPLGEFLAGKE